MRIPAGKYPAGPERGNIKVSDSVIKLLPHSVGEVAWYALFYKLSKLYLRPTSSREW